MLPATEGGIDLVLVGVDPLAPGRRRHTASQGAQTLPAAVTHEKGQHLSRQARDGNPEVGVAQPSAIAHHPRVERQRVALDRRETASTNSGPAGRSRARTRLTVLPIATAIKTVLNKTGSR
jgi:hypothetical protein